jgi:glutamate racemase
MTIALYDSGIGGLSVLREVRALLPRHDMLYLADAAYCPYGVKPEEAVRARALACGRWLERQGATMLVVACNTATAVAIEALREALAFPVVGMEPGIKPAIAATRSGVVGVLATGGTLASRRFSALVQRFANGVEVRTVPCPGLVECVEAGDVAGPRPRALLARYLDGLRDADTLVLGCTHYPFLKGLITELAGPAVRLIDTGPAVARRVASLAQHSATPAHTGALRCATTGDAAAFATTQHALCPELEGAARHVSI